SKAVPVVVSAGLAVGVFCGLLFGLGTGDPTASAAPAKGNNVHAASDDPSGPAPAGLGATPAAAPPPKAGSGGGSSNPVATATGSAAGSAAGSGAGSAVAAKTVDTAKLTIEVEPAAAAAVAKIQIDGKDITGTSIDLPADKKSVKVSVTATGFHSVDKKVDVTGGSETKVQLELTKRATGGTSSPGFGGASTGGNHVPTAPPKPPKKPSNNGIIDI
ncbi:MAG TPA: PEGA domain-containing protein, partial [Kofleriaceae bacterium]